MRLRLWNEDFCFPVARGRRPIDRDVTAPGDPELPGRVQVDVRDPARVIRLRWDVTNLASIRQDPDETPRRADPEVAFGAFRKSRGVNHGDREHAQVELHEPEGIAAGIEHEKAVRGAGPDAALAVPMQPKNQVRPDLRGEPIRAEGRGRR